MYLNGVTVPQASAAAFPREVNQVPVIQADVSTRIIPAPGATGSDGGAKHAQGGTANVWAP